MENDCPRHLSPNLHFNLQVKMPKRKPRSKVGLLNTLQGADPGHPDGPLQHGRGPHQLEGAGHHVQGRPRPRGARPLLLR